MNALCGATAAAAFEDLLVVDLELLLSELVVDLELLLPALALLLKIVGELDGANTSVGADVNTSFVGSKVSSSFVGSSVNGSDVGVKGSGDGDGEEISSQQKSRTPTLIANKHNALSEETCSAPS